MSGGPRHLVDGMPRALPDHRSAAGTALRRHYTALVKEFGPAEPRSLRAIEYGRAAMALLRAQAASTAWLDAQNTRDTGKGRRPSAQAVARLQKRAALEEDSATALIDRLRKMAAKPTTRTPLEQWQAEHPAGEDDADA